MSKKLTLDDIDTKDARQSAIGLAFSLAALTMPRKEQFVGQPPENTSRALIAHVLNWFDDFGLAIVKKEVLPGE